MRVNKWTIGLAAVGLVSLPSGARAEEKASPVMTALSSTMISGYVSSSVWWVPGTGNANLPGFAYASTPGSSKADGFNLDVVKLSIERPLDEGQWSAGYKFDGVFGPDANALSTGSVGASVQDFAIKQAYVALRAPAGNGLDLKLGVWDTIIGYETFDSGNNPNYTRSYGYTIEPTTHTGLLATYQLSEMLGIAAGIANTFGPTINGKAHPPFADHAESYKTYMASIAFTAPESLGFMQGSTLYAGIINGFDSQTAIGDDRTHFYLGGTIATPVKGLKLGASMDYMKADIDSPSAAQAGNDNPYAGAYAAYLSFAATEKLSVHARLEYANSDITTSPGGPPLLGATKVVALTGTLQYDLWKNVLSRLEMRWDHAASGGDSYGGDTVGSPTKKNNFLFAANLIYKF
jgi:hypothetical protein